MHSPNDHVHFVGIGGIGMLALAQYLAAQGVTVSGSDLNDSEGLAGLRSRGVRVDIGHDPANVHGADLVVVTSAAANSNPEVVEAKALGIPVMKRAQLLGEITAGGRTVAVAGTHGKTTTTAMIGHLLREAGVPVTVLSGGFLRAVTGRLMGPAITGSDSMFVAEADEYDRSFLRLAPEIALITGIDYDHPDCYPTIDNLTGAFASFASGVSDRLIVYGPSARAVRIASESGVPFETYGIGDGFDWSATDVEATGTSQSFSVAHQGSSVGRFELRLPGRHNVQNALAALAAACAFTGKPVDDFRPHLPSFTGVVRRLETRGTAAGITVIDDYAHHPAEVAASLEALKPLDRRLSVVFQPHTFTRTQALFDDFADVLSTADEVVLLDIYAAREEPIDGVNSSRLAEAIRLRGAPTTYFQNQDEAVRFVAESARADDVVVTMGAGDVGKLPERILSSLAERAQLDRRNGQPNSHTESATASLSESLHEAGLTRIRADEPMSRHTSWRVGGPADLFAVAESVDGLRAALRLAHEASIACLVLGGGSNVLVSDAGVEGLVILNRAAGLTLIPQGEGAYIDAGSGVFFGRLAHFASRNGLAGLEWGVAIPGTVGAGVVNNSGAHHGDVQRTLVKVEMVDRTGTVSIVDPSELHFRYRQSDLKMTDGSPITHSDTIVTRCWFAAQLDRDGQSKALIEELTARRRATQPISQPSGGSTFKNPEEGSAGALIEACGLKGKSVGDAQFSTKHANFIVNTGQASAADIVRLIHLAHATVREQRGIVLEPEVQVVGRWASAHPLLEDAPLAGVV